MTPPSPHDGASFTSPPRPGFSALSRQHSRSSSQVATLAQLSSTRSSPRRSLNTSRSGSPDGRRAIGLNGDLSSDDEDESEDDDGASCQMKPSVSRSMSLSTASLGESSTSSPTNPQASPGLAQLIQQRRRQVSAPYFASARTASLFSPGAGFGILGHEPNTGTEEFSRSGRSRKSSMGALSLRGQTSDEDLDRGLVMTPTTEEWRQLGGHLSELAELQARQEAEQSQEEQGSDERVLAQTSFSGVSTPSISHSSSSNSSSIDMSRSSSLITSLPPQTVSRPSLVPHQSPPSSASQSAPTTPALDFKPPKSSFSFTSISTNSNAYSSFSAPISPSGAISSRSDPIASSATFTPSHKSDLSSSSIRPTLTKGSFRSTTGSGTSPVLAGPVATILGEETNGAPEIVASPVSSVTDPLDEAGAAAAAAASPTRRAFASMSFDSASSSVPPPKPGSTDETGAGAVPLDRISAKGPVDPSRYSAVTGLRNIDSFVLEGEAGKGAYGSVRKARLKGVDGLPVGEELIIKYVIKQRILADCWKKHKILGPIPVEVHVLDHLRRVPYVARPLGRRRDKRKLGKVPRRDSAPSSIKEGAITGHPNICGMLDFFEDGEFYYLVMLQAGTDPDNPSGPSGQDLFDYVDIHPDGLPPHSIRSILTQIADALQFLHEHGIVHRDLKDENIVLDHTGHLQLIDFGSAAYVSKDGKRFDTFSGTLDFAAPEVLKGQRYGGKETDIWALGVLGYVLICGECPFWSPGEAMRGLEPESRAAEALRAKCSLLSSPLGPSHLSGLLEHYPGAGQMEHAVDLVVRCLEVEAANRPPADEVLNHRFIVGDEGWSGLRGWLEEASDVEST